MNKSLTISIALGFFLMTFLVGGVAFAISVVKIDTTAEHEARIKENVKNIKAKVEVAELPDEPYYTEANVSWKGKSWTAHEKKELKTTLKERVTEQDADPLFMGDNTGSGTGEHGMVLQLIIDHSRECGVTQLTNPQSLADIMAKVEAGC